MTENAGTLSSEWLLASSKVLLSASSEKRLATSRRDLLGTREKLLATSDRNLLGISSGKLLTPGGELTSVVKDESVLVAGRCGLTCCWPEQPRGPPGDLLQELVRHGGEERVRPEVRDRCGVGG